MKISHTNTVTSVHLILGTQAKGSLVLFSPRSDLLLRR